MGGCFEVRDAVRGELGAEGDQELVVGDGAGRGLDGALFGIESGDLGLNDFDAAAGEPLEVAGDAIGGATTIEDAQEGGREGGLRRTFDEDNAVFGGEQFAETICGDDAAERVGFVLLADTI